MLVTRVVVAACYCSEYKFCTLELLSTWSRTLLRKLLVPQLIKTFPTFV